MEVTSIDRALVQRAARLFEATIDGLVQAHQVNGVWPTDRGSQMVRRECQRLARDGLELRALAERIRSAMPKRAAPAPEVPHG